MPGCIILLAGAIWPRFTLAMLWLFSDYPAKAFDTVLWPLVGFFVLPATTLGYELARNWSTHGSLAGGWFLLPAVGLLYDLGYTGAAARR